jgi:hypothetical protein
MDVESKTPKMGRSLTRTVHKRENSYPEAKGKYMNKYESY